MDEEMDNYKDTDKEVDPDKEKEKDAPISEKLQYGDIIELRSLSNSDVHEQGFFIQYIDKKKIRLANVLTAKPHVLFLDETGKLTDESIQEIHILSRSEEKGYARQNGLLPKKWIDIHFGGDFPVILSGEITDLVEDMIEITTYPELDVIYIDFEYKGSPEWLPIEKIVLKSKPASLQKIKSLASLLEKGELEEGLIEEDPASMIYSESGDTILNIPENAEPDVDVLDKIQEVYAKSNTIIFGEDLEDVVQRVEISETERKYTVEIQVNDMLDELLSTIPNYERTADVLEHIHFLIERFKELHHEFSKFDENDNVVGAKFTDRFYKPLVAKIESLNIPMKWILPVTSIRRKVYDTNEPFPDIVSLSTGNILENQSQIQDIRNQGDVPRYTNEQIATHDYMTPYLDPFVDGDFYLYKHQIENNLETIVNTLDNFETNVIANQEISKRRFVIQKYNLGSTKMEKQLQEKLGKKKFVRTELTPNDTVTLRSIIFLPKPILEYSAVSLPSTDILTRASLSDTTPYLFKMLKKNTNVPQYIITDFAKEINYDTAKSNFFSTYQEYVVDGNLHTKKDKFHSFLQCVVPSTASIIQNYRSLETMNQFTMVEMAKSLEPFGIEIGDIQYTHYKNFRYFIKEQIKERKHILADRSKEFRVLQNMKKDFTFAFEKNNTIGRILHENKNLLDILTNIYLKKTSKTSQTLETLSKLDDIDCGKLYALLLQSATIDLFTSGDFIGQLEDMGDVESIKAKDCTRRFLTKKYTSLQDLQKDNGVEDTFYDKEYDETPYSLLKKYQSDAEKSKVSENKFVDFLQENLIQKHDCPVQLAEEMAKSIILGKKRVSDGEYAMLELKPKAKDIDTETSADYKSESEIRTKIQYFKRVKNVWVNAKDEDIGDVSFVDSNTLFCNVKDACKKNTSNSVCEPMSASADRYKQADRKKVIAEFDRRYEKSQEETKKTVETQIKDQIRLVSKLLILQETQMDRANHYAYELGKLAAMDDILASPHQKLFDAILSDPDFSKKQSNIVKFVGKFCREPMIAELKEEPYWLYCVDTNTKLCPLFLFELAKSFQLGEDYAEKQKEACRKYGALSEDGDAIVDKYSGMVIRKIDFMSENVEDIMGDMVIAIATTTSDHFSKKDKVFDTELSNTIYRILITITHNMNVSRVEEIEELVLRLSNEIIIQDVISESAYKKYSEKQIKKTGKTPVSYSMYCNQRILIIVCSVLLIAIQTTTPSVVKYKQSFQGFPENGSAENTTGLRFLAASLLKTKRSDAEPWNAIQNSQGTLVSLMKEVIEKYAVGRDDVIELYRKLQEYKISNPNEFIPDDLSIRKWLQFLPPIVEISKSKKLQGISDEFRKELMTQIQKGNQKQTEMISAFRSKITEFTFGLIEDVNKIVKSKDLLLKTAARIPFLENGCCNEQITPTALDYFIREEKVISTYVKIVDKLAKTLHYTKWLATAPMLFHDKFTGIRYSTPSPEYSTDTIYAAFIHYCHFDRPTPVPEAFRSVCSEKPAEYNPSLSFVEKIKLLKRNGRNYEKNDLSQLMMIVNRENLVSGAIDGYDDRTISALQEMLNYVEGNSTNSDILPAPFVRHFSAILAEYDPKVMVVNDSEATKRFKEYLWSSNENMYNQITSFFQEYGKMKERDFSDLEDFLYSITTWTATDYQAIQFMKNSTYGLVKVYPEMILNKVNIQTSSKHWGLSDLHQGMIQAALSKYYSELYRFQSDDVIKRLIQEENTRLIDLYLLMRLIPVQSSFQKGDHTFRSLFDKETTLQIFKYLWYSILYDYIQNADNDDLIQVEVRSEKEIRQERIRERYDPLTEIEGLENFDIFEDVQIFAGNREDMKKRLADFLYSMLQIDMLHKTTTNVTYEDIQRRTQGYKDKEKKKFTDFFKNMDKDERKVEFLKKNLKLGRWNVGMVKGLVDYDKTTFDKEIQDQIFDDAAAAAEVEEDAQEYGVEDLDQYDEAMAEIAAENEANNINHLGEDYMDGDYYGEDDNIFGDD